MACWLLMGGYILLAANTYTELTTMLPKAGGAFNYTNRAVGPNLGFVAGWLDFLSNALTPTIFCIILGEYSTLLRPVIEPSATGAALAFLTVFMLLNLPGVKSSNIIQ